MAETILGIHIGDLAAILDLYWRIGIVKTGSLDISPAFSFCLSYDGSVLNY